MNRDELERRRLENLRVLLNSAIIQESDHKDWLIKTLKVEKIKAFSLLYRGSRDGWRDTDFYMHCFNKSPNLVIMKSKAGRIFGGFTRIPWRSFD